MRISNVRPDNNKIKVFNKGIPQGSKTEKIPTGGQKLILFEQLALN